MASITGLAGMGTVNKEEHSKDSGLFQQPMPGSNSTAAILLDIFGASRTINISGRFCLGDTGYASVTLFIQALDALVNGSQSSVSYTSDKTGLTYKVLVNTVSWSAEEGSPNHADYTISMTEGNV